MKGAGVVAAVVMLGAAWLRLPGLGERPMHADEAVLADKFGTLLEQGVYRYDPREYHGPALPYLTLPAAWLAGARDYRALSEPLLRAVPAVFGILLVVVPLLLFGSRPAAAAAGLLTALSPAMVYYSRYYIPEMLLAAFSAGLIASGYRYSRTRSLPWALAAGACFGLMLATKETAVIAIGAMAASLCLVSKRPAAFSRPHALAALAAALAVTGLLFQPAGLLELPRAFATYLTRAAAPGPHLHPWHYYFRLLFRYEAFIFLLALAGGAAAVRGRDPLARFLALYALLMTAAYAAIPYKTPWCLVQFLHPWILLAALGVAELWPLCHRPALRIAAAALLTAGAAHLGWQAWSAATTWSADPRNPYVYAHTSRDVRTIAGRLEQVARAAPGGYATRIQIVSPVNLWPLPWYLRRFDRQEWSRSVPPGIPAAPVILATPDAEPGIVEKLYVERPPGEREMYLHLFERYTELRPGVEVRGYVVKSLYDALPSER